MRLKTLFDPRLWVSGRGSGRSVLATGIPAPSFTATAHDGTVVRSEDYKNQKYVLWFFPAADTPVCTKQGCGFRDHIQEFKKAGVEVFGVSFDTVEENQRFATKYDFPFKLLSDVTREMGTAYGAADDTDTKYARRIAYVIDRGMIVKAYDVKDGANHAARVLADLTP